MGELESFLLRGIYYSIYISSATPMRHSIYPLSILIRGKQTESDNKLLAISLIMIFQINKLDWDRGLKGNEDGLLAAWT